MGILRSLGKFLSRPLFEVQMVLSDDAVLFLVRRGSTPIRHADLDIQRGLPDPLLSFLKQQTPIEDGRYHLPFPIARRLSQELVSHTSDTFKLDATRVDRLREILVPDDFRIHWQYDTAQQRLIRRLHGAEGHLGQGWFFRGENVWQVASALPDNLLSWLYKPVIISKELVFFYTKVFPKLKGKQYSCELSVADDFDVNVTIVKMLKRSVDVQVSSSRADLTRHLNTISGDPKNLISSTTILLGWREKLRGQLLSLTKSGDVQRVQGDDLLAFIQDDLTPNAALLGVDIALLQSNYRILDAAQCAARWNLDHVVVGGIGHYRALPCLDVDGQPIPIEQLDRKIMSGTRFHALEDGWLEFTGRFMTRYDSWKQKGLKPIRLLPQEVLGTHLERLNKLKLHPPSISKVRASSEIEQANLLLETMRRHGLPCGFSGLQQDANTILAEVCKRLLDDNRSVQILWLLPKRKLGNAASSLKKLGVPHSTTASRQQGYVLIASPDTQISDLSWDLVVFTDIDTIAAGERQSRAYSGLQRTWSISTFNREDWHRDVLRSQRILVSLGLSKADLTAFLELCVGSFSQQADGLFSRLVSPFKRILVDADPEDNQGQGVPIPPRHTSSAQRPLKNTDDVYRPSFTVSVNVSSPRSHFLDQARRFANHTGSPVESVPFIQYWPTYDSMTQAQKKWYFYWRSQVRMGSYLPSDLSYLFVHIYEIIHLVGVDSAQVAYDYLVSFWKNYRSIYPKLDNYLVDWIADFIVVHQLPKRPLEWYADAATIAKQLTNSNLAIESWLSTSQDVSQIPGAILESTCAYRYTKSKFYQQHESRATIDAELRRALDVVNDFVYQQHGKSLFEYYRPGKTMEIQRQPFAGAVYEGPRDKITLATVSSWDHADGLQNAITSILKHAENRLRRQQSFRGTLRGIDLPEEWVRVLNEAFPVGNRSSSPDIQQGFSKSTHTDDYEPLVIDMEAVMKKREESSEVTELLLLDDDRQENREEQLIEHGLDKSMQSEKVSLNIDRPDDTPEGLLTDLAEVAETILGDTSSISLLRHMMDANWEANQDDAQMVLDAEFLSVVLDRLNEKALELLGDQLIFIEGHTLVVTEDFRDEIAHILIASNEAKMTSMKLDEATYDELEPEWAKFVAQMSSHHWEALNALLLGEDVIARLDGIARGAFTTVDLLIDEINEAALVSIGDIVIETDDEPVVEDEDVESLHALVEWASTSQIMNLD